MPSKAPLLALIALGAPLFLASVPALAADDKKDDTKKSDSKKNDATKNDATKDDTKKDDDKDKGDKDKGDKDKPKATAVDDELDPFEDPNKTYRFIGLRYRDAIAPKFIINWFADGGRNVNVPMVGPEFISRRDHLEIAVALMYADYSMDPFLFKAKGDPDTAYELVQSALKLGYLMVDIMYEIPLEKRDDKTGRFALLIGGGVGIAGVFGSLYRAQAYPNMPGADPGTPSQWGACTGPNDPKQPTFAAATGYCSNPTNAHYWPNWKASSPTQVNANGPLPNTYNEGSWANSGSKPLIFPWIALPQISFRYKPIKQFQVKADLGFSTSGFFFGFSASYGLPSSSSTSSSPSSSTPSGSSGK